MINAAEMKLLITMISDVTQLCNFDTVEVVCSFDLLCNVYS